MKIKEVVIRLEPNETEVANGATIRDLVRNNNKQWSVRLIDSNLEIMECEDDKKGLYPHEIKLINMIQEDVISKFNANAAK